MFFLLAFSFGLVVVAQPLLVYSRWSHTAASERVRAVPKYVFKFLMYIPSPISFNFNGAPCFVFFSFNSAHFGFFPCPPPPPPFSSIKIESYGPRATCSLCILRSANIPLYIFFLLRKPNSLRNLRNQIHSLSFPFDFLFTPPVIPTFFALLFRACSACLAAAVAAAALCLPGFCLSCQPA